jgi:hypothetical protein
MCRAHSAKDTPKPYKIWQPFDQTSQTDVFHKKKLHVEQAKAKPFF